MPHGRQTGLVEPLRLQCPHHLLCLGADRHRFLFPAEARATALCAFLVFWIVTELATIAYEEVVFIFTGTTWELKTGFWTSTDTEYLLFGVHVVWWFGAMLAIFRSVDPRKYSSHLAPLIGLFAVTFALIYVLPHDPIFKSRNFEIRNANLWEYVRANWSGDREKETQTRTVASAAEAARVERSQPALLEQGAGSLSPQRPGVADVYVVGVSGWADQEVFRKELDGAFDAFSRSFGIQGRTLKLINDPDTVATAPMATRQNFAAAVRSVARVMDRQEDILLLVMTSHGDKRGIALQFAGLVYGSLTPEDVAAVLTEEGIRNRIVIVSACYSGVFVKPLADDNTIVLTAADAHSTSFGCSNERAWTYFGDALFNQSLLPGRNLETAFDAAKGLIAEWEARDGVSPSNPQAHFGAALKEKLSAVYDFARSAERDTRSP